MAGRRILNNIYYKYFKGNKYLVLGTTTSIKDRHNKRIKYIGYGYHTEKEKEYFVYKVYQNKYLILDTDSKPLKGPHIVYRDKKGKLLNRHLKHVYCVIKGRTELLHFEI